MHNREVVSGTRRVPSGHCMKPSKRILRNVISDAMGVNAANKLVWAPDLPIVYVDNPKCGSTTIKNTLKHAQANLFEARGCKYRLRDDPHKADDCLRQRGLRLNDCRHRYVISCVRNPFTRALSGFLDKVATRDPRYFPELRSRPVETFEEHLLALAEYPAKRLNFHFRPQFLNLDFPNLIYDAVFYLEHLAVFSDFCRKVAPQLTLETYAPHARASRSKLHEHYSERAVDIVRSIYAEDFRLFGYNTDLEETDRLPGLCIIANRIVPEGTDIETAIGSEPANAAVPPTYEAIVRYHRLVEMLTL